LSGQLKAEDLESYGCSQHAFTVCHPNAICTDIDETNFTCTCKEGYEGDGLLAGQGCGRKFIIHFPLSFVYFVVVTT
jgi:hypothetical protein